MNVTGHLLAILAALAAGFVNALAGGGTLITFPTLLGIGLPAVSANMTSSVALLPGFLGGSLAQRTDLAGQKKRLGFLLPAAVLGGLIGALLLLSTSEKVFTQIVPFLILAASILLAVQAPLRNWLDRRRDHAAGKFIPEAWVFLPVFLCAIYGGYFGAGMSVIVLALLALLINDSLTRLNALKQSIAFSVNFTAALLFVFSGRVSWSVALVMMAGALLGGTLGGRLARRVKPSTLRWIVVALGFTVGVIYLVRTYFLK
jgi:uncharacterized protein